MSAMPLRFIWNFAYKVSADSKSVLGFSDGQGNSHQQGNSDFRGSDQQFGNDSHAQLRFSSMGGMSLGRIRANTTAAVNTMPMPTMAMIAVV